MPGPYTLSGSGVQSIASPAALRIEILTVGSRAVVGEANPTNRYHVGLLRFGNGTSFQPAIAVDADDQWLPAPNNATQLGYALFGGSQIRVTELAASGTATPPPVASIQYIDPDVITPLSWLSLGVEFAASAVGRVTSYAPPLANAVIYVPFRILEQRTWSSMFSYFVGSSANHVDMGVYSTSGTLLGRTGSVIPPVGMAIISMSALTLAPGRYYLALTCDSTSFTFGAVGASIAFSRTWGVLTQLSTFPLPATATFAGIATGGWGNVPVFGLTQRSTM